MIVVDVGCKEHNGQNSIDALVARFRPDVLYGFDPHPDCAFTSAPTWKVGDTLVMVERKAAWTYDGEVLLAVDSSATRIGAGTDTVECFDFAAWLQPLVDRGNDVVVKLDCEGAEFALLAALRERSLLERLSLLLVEWHLPCPVEAWS